MGGNPSREGWTGGILLGEGARPQTRSSPDVQHDAYYPGRPKLRGGNL